jgi:hypothetical protein
LEVEGKRGLEKTKGVELSVFRDIMDNLFLRAIGQVDGKQKVIALERLDVNKAYLFTRLEADNPVPVETIASEVLDDLEIRILAYKS